MAIVSLRIGHAIIVSRRTKGYRCALIYPWSLWLTSLEHSCHIERVSFCIYRPLPARLQLKRWSSTKSVPGREAPDPAPVDPVLPAPDPAALRGPVAALRDCVARAAAQEEQGAGVRLIRFQAFVFDDLSQVFRQHRTLPHRINARLGIQRCAIADREDLGMRNAAQRLF